MKMSKHDRKIFNQGKAFGCAKGYAEGYAQGLHDGNPFIRMAEAFEEMGKRVSEAINNPETLKMLEEARQMQDDMDALEIEGEGNDSV